MYSSYRNSEVCLRIWDCWDLPLSVRQKLDFVNFSRRQVLAIRWQFCRPTSAVEMVSRICRAAKPAVGVKMGRSRGKLQWDMF
jgi:hypothetical protein